MAALVDNNPEANSFVNKLPLDKPYARDNHCLRLLRQSARTYLYDLESRMEGSHVKLQLSTLQQAGSLSCMFLT